MALEQSGDILRAIAGDTQFIETILSPGVIGFPQILMPNPLRAGVMFMSPGGSTVLVAPTVATLQQSCGFTLTSQPIELTIKDWGSLVQSGWYCSNIGAATSLYIIEAVFIR